ncbi:oxygen-independent coproporphyrinogen III oxidase [Daejeonella sp.]|jgi:oxygen-independent coproporphyrinogen-3 oxidase|uniref:oxygen-independent coproporphyrinogen III oxidase n=1 Tax=Daejeonella sp. TaxID=2805397 RepID=UPI0037C10BF1
MNMQQLINKYHVAAPRYTSYPTVPYWDTAAPDINEWKTSVKFSFDQSNASNGISLYVHLPFCESLCTYCGCNTRITKNHHVEDPYIQAILKEWKLYREIFEEKPLIREIHLGGGTPTFFDAANLNVLINGLMDGSVIHSDAEFSFEAHPNNTSEAHLITLYKLGFRRISLGIQDFDPRVQKIINRVQSFEQVQKITSLAREIGYTSINFDLIYGLPLQTALGLAETILQVEKLMPDRIAFYSYAHVPWIKPGQRSFTEEDLPSVTEKQKLYELGRQKFITMGFEEIGMDHFALPTDSLYKAERSGKLHRNFMGYTHQYTQLMIGLGVSSISDSWFAFAQNVKKVEDYYDLINKGQFPVLKGHHLTEVDLMIRRHILNLMCTGKTDWDSPLSGNNELIAGLERAKLLEQDGLVEILENKLIVTPLGKRFLRNICMTLDARLWSEQPEAQLFSMAG